MNKVVVTVVGSQKDATGTESRIELISEGKHYYKNGINYVLYSDSELSGVQGTSTLLKIGDDHMTLIRKGDVMQEQYFARAYESTGIYKTPYGNLSLSVKTNDINIKYGSVSGTVIIDYALSMEGQWQSDNLLHIEICADKKEKNQLN
ncbi:DUF1934 domain-containing protein [Propionispira raffinosivorans]|uniref:DUF1934 domain-containing protein n=1 Tax=Propionispira raffinosivorans TaxID=86959 RepID=UPI0003757322|nr:DUF1934 domain-containing protein [Propionispira raffinosivorans]